LRLERRRGEIERSPYFYMTFKKYLITEFLKVVGDFYNSLVDALIILPISIIVSTTSEERCGNETCMAYDSSKNNNCLEYQEFGSFGHFTECIDYIKEKN